MAWVRNDLQVQVQVLTHNPSAYHTVRVIRILLLPQSYRPTFPPHILTSLPDLHPKHCHLPWLKVESGDQEEVLRGRTEAMTIRLILDLRASSVEGGLVAHQSSLGETAISCRAYFSHLIFCSF